MNKDEQIENLQRIIIDERETHKRREKVMLILLNRSRDQYSRAMIEAASKIFQLEKQIQSLQANHNLSHETKGDSF